METLYCLLFVSTLYSSTYSWQNIADLATHTDLGNIPLPVTELKVLNAFVRANPQLPARLKVTNRNGLIHVSPLFPDLNKAVIDVRMDPSREYTGHVEVFFNGGPRRVETGGSVSQTGNTWAQKMNLSVEPNLNTNLGRLSNSEPTTVINAFMDRNPHLPSELRGLLRATPKRRGASLYVPQPNNRYEGNVVVSF